MSTLEIYESLQKLVDCGKVIQTNEMCQCSIVQSNGNGIRNTHHNCMLSSEDDTDANTDEAVGTLSAGLQCTWEGCILSSEDDTNEAVVTLAAGL